MKTAGMFARHRNLALAAAENVARNARGYLVAALGLVLGLTLLLSGVAISEGLMPPDSRMDRFFEVVNLEKGLVLGVAAFVVGLGLISDTANLKRTGAARFAGRFGLPSQGAASCATRSKRPAVNARSIARRPAELACGSSP